MANKQFHILSSRTRSPTLLFTICPFTFSLLFSLFSLSTGHPSASPYSNTIPNLSLKPETSFVAALEHFKSSSSTFPTASEEDVPRFDDQVFPKSPIDFTENHTARWICQLGRIVPRFDDQVFPKSAIDFTENHTAHWICQLAFTFTFTRCRQNSPTICFGCYRDADNLTSNGSRPSINRTGLFQDYVVLAGC